jgi:type VI secretion system protein ImpL
MASRGGAGGGEMREVTQPVFLGHLLSHVVLQDQAALGASGASTKVSGMQRVLLTLTTVVAGILILLFMISFFANRSLEGRVTDAAKAAMAVPYDASQPPSAEALQKLDALRTELEQLNTWNRDGAPWYMRWGLYVGDAIQPHARRAYFNRFHDLMFGQTQEGMRTALSRLPASPGPTDECSPYYDQLKAYLITTSHPDKSTREWLPPVLHQYWPSGRNADDERRRLALAQFEFYSDELKIKNPFSPEVDVPTVERARGYLSRCAATDQVYRAMKADVAKRVKSFNFNRKYPDSVGVVTNNVEVEGAFQKDGWALMQEAIRNPAKYIGGEKWVLGEQVAVSVDLGRLESDLRARYQTDFINKWREVMNSTTVVGYGSMRDAAQKLLRHSSNQPPLIVLFCEASHNTSVDNPEVQKAFQAVQQVEPAACMPSGTPVQAPNAPYVQALLQLQGCIEQASTAPPDQERALKAQCYQALTPARTAARQVALALKPDPDAKLDKRIGSLMDDTIAKLDPVLRGDGGEGDLCSAFRLLREKYPFNSASRTQAGIDDVGVFFMPVSGQLAKWYEARKDTFSTQGTMYVQNPAATVRYSANFLRFFNEAMAIQRALYPNNATVMKYQFSVRQGPIEGATAVSVNIYGKAEVFGVGVPTAKSFEWPGNSSEVSISAVLAGGSPVGVGSYSGPWALTQMLSRADSFTPLGNGGRMLRLPTSGSPPEPMLGVGNKPIRIVLDMDSGNSPFIFDPRFFPRMTCTR